MGLPPGCRKEPKGGIREQGSLDWASELLVPGLGLGATGGPPGRGLIVAPCACIQAARGWTFKPASHLPRTGFAERERGSPGQFPVSPKRKEGPRDSEGSSESPWGQDTAGPFPGAFVPLLCPPSDGPPSPQFTLHL